MPPQARASRRRSAPPHCLHCQIHRHAMRCRKILQRNDECWRYSVVFVHEVRMTDLAGRRPIRPVILAGGAGTRLWPLSTIATPKHLLPLLGKRSLFEQTLDRFGEHFAPPIIVANQAQEAELRNLAARADKIILEPCKRDSAAAIALAAASVDDEELL